MSDETKDDTASSEAHVLGESKQNKASDTTKKKKKKKSSKKKKKKKKDKDKDAKRKEKAKKKEKKEKEQKWKLKEKSKCDKICEALTVTVINGISVCVCVGGGLYFAVRISCI